MASSFYSALVQEAQRLVRLRLSQLRYEQQHGDAIDMFRAALNLDDARIALHNAIEASTIDMKVAS